MFPRDPLSSFLTRTTVVARLVFLPLLSPLVLSQFRLFTSQCHLCPWVLSLSSPLAQGPAAAR